MMMSMVWALRESEFDLRFLNAMIPHHDGAVTMAQGQANQALTQIKQPGNSLVSKRDEIAQMKRWKQTWYKQ